MQSSATLPLQGDLSDPSIPHPPHTGTRRPGGKKQEWQSSQTPFTYTNTLKPHDRTWNWTSDQGNIVRDCTPTFPGDWELVLPALFSSRALYFPFGSSIQQQPTTSLSTINLTTHTHAWMHIYTQSKETQCCCFFKFTSSFLHTTFIQIASLITINGFLWTLISTVFLHTRLSKITSTKRYSEYKFNLRFLLVFSKKRYSFLLRF